MKRVTDLLTACGTADGVLPPSTLYNEGWMLRLVLDFSYRNPGQGPFSFLPGSRWYSEILLRSPFLPRNRRDRPAESWTHADGAIGHFDVGGSGSGDLVIHSDARQLVIFEAKMFSGLSPGTRNAPNFDQAARTVACISEVLKTKDINPASMEQLEFVVLAPKEQIDNGIFTNLHKKREYYPAQKATWRHKPVPKSSFPLSLV